MIYRLGAYKNHEMIDRPLIEVRQNKESAFLDSLFEWLSSELEKRLGLTEGDVKEGTYIFWEKEEL